MITVSDASIHAILIVLSYFMILATIFVVVVLIDRKKQERS
jgi:hypothetical protein